MTLLSIRVMNLCYVGLYYVWITLFRENGLGRNSLRRLSGPLRGTNNTYTFYVVYSGWEHRRSSWVTLPEFGFFLIFSLNAVLICWYSFPKYLTHLLLLLLLLSAPYVANLYRILVRCTNTGLLTGTEEKRMAFPEPQDLAPTKLHFM